VFNVLYLTFASSCLYAVLKRGYFILRCPWGADPILQAWEIQLRSPAPKVDRVTWNVDNYYMVVFFVMILTTSFIAVASVFRDGSVDTFAKGVTGLMALLHAIPLAACVRSIGLSRRIRLLSRKRITEFTTFLSAAD
jgi:hypothetical protein